MSNQKWFYTEWLLCEVSKCLHLRAIDSYGCLGSWNLTCNHNPRTGTAYHQISYASPNSMLSLDVDGVCATPRYPLWHLKRPTTAVSDGFKQESFHAVQRHSYRLELEGKPAHHSRLSSGLRAWHLELSTASKHTASAPFLFPCPHARHPLDITHFSAQQSVEFMPGKPYSMSGCCYLIVACQIPMRQAAEFAYLGHVSSRRRCQAPIMFSCFSLRLSHMWAWRGMATDGASRTTSKGVVSTLQLWGKAAPRPTAQSAGETGNLLLEYTQQNVSEHCCPSERCIIKIYNWNLQ